MHTIPSYSDRSSRQATQMYPTASTCSFASNVCDIKALLPRQRHRERETVKHPIHIGTKGSQTSGTYHGLVSKEEGSWTIPS